MQELAALWEPGAAALPMNSIASVRRGPLQRRSNPQVIAMCPVDIIRGMLMHVAMPRSCRLSSIWSLSPLGKAVAAGKYAGTPGSRACDDGAGRFISESSRPLPTR